MIDDNAQKKSKVRFVDQTRPGRVSGIFVGGPQPPDSQEAAPVANQPPSGQPEDQPPAATPTETKPNRTADA
jgi:hypothetical protein